MVNKDVHYNFYSRYSIVDCTADQTMQVGLSEMICHDSHGERRQNKCLIICLKVGLNGASIYEFAGIAAD